MSHANIYMCFNAISLIHAFIVCVSVCVPLRPMFSCHGLENDNRAYKDEGVRRGRSEGKERNNIVTAELLYENRSLINAAESVK